MKHNYKQPISREIFSAHSAAIRAFREEPRAFKHISHEFAKKFILFRGLVPDTLAYHRLLVLCDSTIRDLEQCSKAGLSINKFSGAVKWLKKAKQMYADLYNGIETRENVEFDEIMYEFFIKGGVL